MIYVAWDAFVNPYHKDRKQALTSKVLDRFLFDHGEFIEKRFL